MNLSFWRGKKVLLTGHTGFKGSWLSLWLQQLGAEVTGYALAPPTRPSLFECADVGAGMRSVIGDVRDGVLLARTLDECRPDVVIHMAAQPLVRRSYADPVETYATNVMGTVHLLEAVRRSATVRAVVNVTTDKCYENQEWVWGYRENEPLGGFDPYSSSKACSELVTSAYRRSFFSARSDGVPAAAIASARAGNVIGGGDWAADRLVPDVLAAFIQSRPARIRNPRATRPWQHVLEPLRGYLTLAERLYLDGEPYAQAWNFGPQQDDVRPVEWIVRHLAKRWSGTASWTVDEDTHPHEAGLLMLDTAKAAQKLNWRPAMNLENALDLIVDWARRHESGVNVQATTLAQIQAYELLLNTPVLTGPDPIIG